MSVNYDCQRCSFVNICHSNAIKHEQLSILEQLGAKKKILRKNNVLHKVDQRFKALYVVRSGSFKSYFQANSQTERIIGFYFPGEVIGFNAIASNLHEDTAVALETSSVCEINYTNLLSLETKVPSLYRQLLVMMSQQLEPNRATSPGCDASQRIAIFLANLSLRYQHLGLASTQFRLSMSRQDIGQYLGLSTETVSRVLAQLARSGVIGVMRREIEILDMSALHGLSCK